MKSMKWKMMIPILSAVAVIIFGFAYVVYTTTSKSVHNQGIALVQSVELGLEGAILSRNVAEDIMEQEMVGRMRTCN